MWRILLTWHNIGLQLQISNKNGYILLMLSWSHYKVSTIWPETSTNERSPGQCEIEQPQFRLAGSYSIRILQPESFLTKNIQIWRLPALQNLHLHSSVTIILDETSIYSGLADYDYLPFSGKITKSHINMRNDRQAAASKVTKDPQPSPKLDSSSVNGANKGLYKAAAASKELVWQLHFRPPRSSNSSWETQKKWRSVTYEKCGNTKGQIYLQYGRE